MEETIKFVNISLIAAGAVMILCGQRMKKSVVWFLTFLILTIIFYGAWFICMLVYASNIDKKEDKLTEYK